MAMRGFEDGSGAKVCMWASVGMGLARRWLMVEARCGCRDVSRAVLPLWFCSFSRVRFSFAIGASVKVMVVCDGGGHEVVM